MKTKPTRPRQITAINAFATALLRPIRIDHTYRGGRFGNPISVDRLEYQKSGERKSAKSKVSNFSRFTRAVLVAMCAGRFNRKH